jgi:MscS family membrane protein
MTIMRCLDKSAFILLMVTVAFSVGAGWAGPAPAEAPAADAASVTAAEAAQQSPVNLTSPHAAVSSFLAAMNEVAAGDHAAIRNAAACLYLGRLPESERETIGVQRAQDLFTILDSTTVPLENIPQEVEEGNREVAFVVSFAEKGLDEFKVTLHRYDDGLWRVDSETVESVPEFLAALTTTPEEVAPVDQSVDPRLTSPRGTMRTFIEGMNRWDDGGDVDALLTLDLSELEETVRDEKGHELAVMLKRILDRHAKVVYQEIPNDPDGEAWVHLRDDAGNITLAPVKNEETGALEWKFTSETLAKLVDLYDVYKEREVVVDESDAAAPHVLSVTVRDWVYGRFPFLLKRTVLLENWQWVGLFATIIAGMAVSRLVSFLLVLVLRRWFRRQHMSLSGRLEKDFVRPIRIALMAWVWLLALSPLGLPADTLYYLRVAAYTVSAAGGVWAVYRLIDIVGQFLTERAARTQNKFDDILVPLTTRSLKIFVVMFGVLFVAEVAGFNSTKVLAGLGLGGLAFALAAKDTVANVFGSLTILLDRPFQIGDWVIVGNAEGSVESVGIRSTRIRTFYNSLITVPNSEIINATIDNMGARRYRRIKTMIAVTYDTPPEKIEAFCEGIRELIRKHPYTRKDYYHVWLNQFDAASLNILLYCFHETPEWGTELRERHRLFLDIIRLAQRLGVEFAFPTQTLYMRQNTPGANSPEAPPTPEEALTLGRDQAERIVQEFLGDDDGPKPPPVEY